MGWFNKKEEVKRDSSKMSLPDFPRLPELPELPPLSLSKPKEPLPQLPSFPTNPLGEKFSQNIIKDAIAGKPDFKFSPYPEVKKSERTFEANDFATSKQEMQTMQRPLKQQSREFEMPKVKEVEPEEENFEDFEVEDAGDEEETKEYNETYQEEQEGPRFEYKPEFRSSKSKKNEPVFIRIDKFEESMKAFEKAKKEVLEIERMLKDIMKVKEEEEKQLDSWAKDILRIKEQIDKVDKDIFSKLE
ncbi:MAG: hypothetical protein AABW51_05020 [Nanoarchaeota archaeon]